MKIYVVQTEKRGISCHQSQKTACQAAGITPNTLRNNKGVYNKDGIKIDSCELVRMTNRGKNYLIRKNKGEQ